MSDGAAEALFHKKEHTFSPALKTFASWLDTYQSNQVNEAIKRNMKNIFPKNTVDVCIMGIAHKSIDNAYQ